MSSRPRKNWNLIKEVYPKNMQAVVDIDYASKLRPEEAQWLNAAMGGLYRGDWRDATELGINPSKGLKGAANSDRYGISEDVLTADYSSLDGVSQEVTIGDLVDRARTAKTALRKAGKSIKDERARIDALYSPEKKKKKKKAPKAEPISPGNPKLNETVEQFLARGGGINKL